MKVVVANDKGGIGKSLIAQFVVIRMRERGLAPRIVDLDRQPKLRRVFGQEAVASLGVGPSFADQMQGDQAVSGFWDPLYDWLSDARPTVVDFGAQAWDSFADWAEASGLGGLSATAVTVLVPVTADVEAFSGAERVLARVGRILCGARTAVLSCDKDGRVDDLAGIEGYRRMLAAAGGAATLRVPVLQREGYPALAAAGLNLDRIAVAPVEELTRATGLGPAAIARAANNVRQWLAEMDEGIGTFLWSAATNPAETAPAEPLRSVMPRPAIAIVRRTRPQVAAASQTAPSAGVPQSAAQAAVLPQPAVPQSATSPAAATPAAPEPGMAREEFDERSYLALYPDVAKAVREGLVASGYDHFSDYGKAEGRLARRLSRVAIKAAEGHSPA